VSLSVTVMAHPVRRVFAESLRLQLDARIVYDQIGDRWDTGRRAWQLRDLEADHHMVIQDDAVPSRHLLDSVSRALEVLPAGSPLVLYCSRTGAYRRRLLRVSDGVSFLVAKQIIWGPAIVLPRELIGPAIEHGDRLTRSQLSRLKGNYDLRLSVYFEKAGIPVYYTWPCLVDHRDLPSLVPGRNGGRHAARFDLDARPDWSGRIEDLQIGPRTQKIYLTG
jgi:hypothetical protein